jgi:hypothetical protein
MQLIKILQKLFIILFIGAWGSLWAVTVVVNSTADTDGTPPYNTPFAMGSLTKITLRSAVRFSQANSGTIINFDIPTSDFGFQPLTNTWLIKPLAIMGQGAAYLIDTFSVIIDGYPGNTAFPAVQNTNSFAAGSNAILRIEIRGTGIGDGITLPSSAFRIDSINGCVFSGLCINNYLGNVLIPVRGQCIRTSGDTTISGNFLGTNILGNTAINTCLPVEIDDGTSTIGGNNPADSNVIASSLENFGCITFFDGFANTVKRNYIGTDKTGQFVLGLTTQGIVIADTLSNFIIDTNLVSGCSGMAMQIVGAGHIIQNNLVGTDATGTRVLGNTTGIGLFAGNTAQNITVQNNFISGNAAGGIQLYPFLGFPFSLQSNTITSNTIGLDTSGTKVLGNGRAGIILENANDTSITSNLISGNAENGIFIGSRSLGSNISSNIIGSSQNGIQTVDSNGRSFGNGIGIQMNVTSFNTVN